MQPVSQELWQQVTGTLPDEAARGLIVRFEMVAEEDETASSAQGRPVFVDREYIEVRSPNDPYSAVHRRVEEKDKRTYPQAYKRWKEGADEAVTGTPLKEWAPIARSQVEQLGIRGVRTVEQFAEVSDDGCHQMGHGFLTLRNKALAWLRKAQDASATTQLAAELQQANLQIQALQRQVQEMATLSLRADDSDEAPRRGRPRKEANP